MFKIKHKGEKKREIWKMHLFRKLKTIVDIRLSPDNIRESNFFWINEMSRELTAESLFISDCRRPTTSSRRGLAAPGVARGLARAYPCPRPLLPRGDAPRTKSDRPRHRRINHNSVSSINQSLSLSLSFPWRELFEHRRVLESWKLRPFWSAG